MPEPNDESGLEPEAGDEYRLAPAEPPPNIEPAWKVPDKSDDPPPDREEHQFSLAELLALTAVVAVIMSIFSSIARWTGWAKSPAALAALFAYALGFAALVSMIALAFVPHARRIVVLGWWVLLGSYIVTATAAALMRK